MIGELKLRIKQDNDNKLKWSDINTDNGTITTTLNLYVHPNMEQKKKCITKMFKSLGK